MSDPAFIMIRMEREKECPKCQRTRDLSEFSFRDSDRTKLQSYCRECSNKAWREWYRNERNRQRHLTQLALRRRRRSKGNMELLARLKDRPCADCGRRFPSYVMDFDHVGPKTGAVSSFVRSSSPERLLAEAMNCEVVCANCHRLRTWRRLKAETES